MQPHNCAQATILTIHRQYPLHLSRFSHHSSQYINKRYIIILIPFFKFLNLSALEFNDKHVSYPVDNTADIDDLFCH